MDQVQEKRITRQLNIGDVLHIIQIAVLIASIGVAYERFDQVREAVVTHTRQLDRVEHYLSSKDPEYWQRSREE